MRVLLVAVLCSGALLGQAALADSLQPEPSAAPLAPVQSDPSSPAQPQSSAVPGTAASPALPSNPTENGTENATENANVNLDEVVCKSSPPTTGTRFGGGRECHTARQWQQRQVDAQRLLQQQQRIGYKSKGG
jgi:hypothetical protein